MFALEINFHDGVSQPEMLLVRRPQAILGSSDYAHVVIESSGSLTYELRLSRGLGRQFSCQKFGKAGTQSMSQMLSEGIYETEAEIDLGEVTTTITSLDVDLLLRQGESPDLAGVRVLRRALTCESPLFPVVVIAGPSPVFVSFSPDTPLLIGRSRKCGLRLDASDISAEHARIGFENGVFWVEDLGSTNGTFVKGERVVGRRSLGRGEAVQIGSEYKIFSLNSAEEVAQFSNKNKELGISVAAPQTHPCLVASNDEIAPNRFVIEPNARVLIGRDPASDLWTGVAHVSGKHCEISSDSQGRLSIVDYSRNGTSINGRRLERDKETLISDGVTKIDLGAGIILTLYLKSEDETRAHPGESSPIATTHNESSDRQRAMGQSLLETKVMPETALRRSVAESSELSASGGGGSVFEQLARRAGNRAGEGPGGSLFPDAGPRSPLGAGRGVTPPPFAVEERDPLAMSKVGRALLVLAVIVLGIVLLLLIGWFLGNGTF